MLSVFELVSCKPGASRELALSPQGLYLTINLQMPGHRTILMFNMFKIH